MSITVLPLPDDKLKPLPDPDAALPFGQIFTDRMYTHEWTEANGWGDAKIEPYGPLSLDPSTSVFHYAQEFFEGTKAYRRPDGNINLFRTIENCKRFNQSARRAVMPEVDIEHHFEAIRKLVELENRWVPNGAGQSLYIRPTMIATAPRLGLKPGGSYLHFVILSPSGAYFVDGFNPVSVYISDEFVRAVPGGTGSVKMGGNYAAAIYVAQQVYDKGYHQVLYLDGIERKYIEEVGAMNIAFVMNGKHIVTPKLSGSILPGITRKSVLEMAPDLGYTVSEERIDINDIVKGLETGDVTEAFGMGTAAVIAPVDKFGWKGKDLVVGAGGVGPVATNLYTTLTDIQYGRIADPYGWTHTIEVA